MAELTMFFSELGGRGNVRPLAGDRIRQHEERIRVYEEMQERFAGRDEIQPRTVTLRFGLEMERAALRFWRSVDEDGVDEEGKAVGSDRELRAD